MSTGGYKFHRHKCDECGTIWRHQTCRRNEIDPHAHMCPNQKCHGDQDLIYKPIEVGPKHPFWRAIDDDDWGGRTAANWLRNHVTDTYVTIIPPRGCDPALLARVREAIEQFAHAVEVKGPNADAG